MSKIQKNKEKKTLNDTKNAKYRTTKKNIFGNLSFLKQVLYYINEGIYLCLINKLLMRHISDTLIKIN